MRVIILIVISLTIILILIIIRIIILLIISCIIVTIIIFIALYICIQLIVQLCYTIVQLYYISFMMCYKYCIATIVAQPTSHNFTWNETTDYTFRVKCRPCSWIIRMSLWISRYYMIRPISVLSFWISEGLTQAQS